MLYNKSMKYINDNVLLFDNSIKSINLYARKNFGNEENFFVEKYVNFLSNIYKNYKNKKAAIFIEPKIDGGYPDIVLVEYYLLKPRKKKSHLATLSSIHFKLLFYIFQKKYVSKKECRSIIMSSKNSTDELLSDLALNGYIKINGNIVRYVDNNIKITKIRSIEAKISNWNQAITQASKNIWFANESYILIKKTHCNKKYINKCKQLGIGIIIENNSFFEVLSSQTSKYPVSFCSFRFKGWLDNALALE